MPAHRLTAPIAAHGALVLKLTNGVPAPVPTFTHYAAAGPGSVLAGGATPRVVNGTATVVGFVGNGGTLTLTGIDGGSSGGTKLLTVDYINADVTFSNTACSNCRNAFFSVNGGPAVQAQMPLSGQVRGVLGWRRREAPFFFLLKKRSEILRDFDRIAELGHRIRGIPPRAAGLPPRCGEQRTDREPECVHARLPPPGRRCLSGAAGGGAAGRIASPTRWRLVEARSAG